MMDMRDKIAEIVASATRQALSDFDVPTEAINGDIELDDGCRATADAIMAEMSGMIPDLVWVDTVEQGVAYSRAEGYCVHRVVDVFHTGSEWVCHWPEYASRRWFKTKAEAKAAANEHHKAERLKGLGWTK